MQRIDTPLPIVANIVNRSQLLLAGVHGTLSESLIDDLQQVYQSSLRFHDRLEQALLTDEEKSNQLLHDLRGPLNVVIGYSEIMLDGMDGPVNDSQRRLLENIHKDAMIVSARILEIYG
jgi:signal transduction histidine kinase